MLLLKLYVRVYFLYKSNYIDKEKLHLKQCYFKQDNIMPNLKLWQVLQHRYLRKESCLGIKLSNNLTQQGNTILSDSC